MPLVNDGLLKVWLIELRDKGAIAVEGLAPRGGITDDTIVALKIGGHQP
jgi:hypothetical protein